VPPTTVFVAARLTDKSKFERSKLMCTAIIYGENNRYFGRNLDYEKTFGESVVIVPRNFCLPFRYAPKMCKHYAFIGMAHVANGYPLLYEATNEAGLSIAGLNFVGNCHFATSCLDMHENLCQFEIIPYIMGKCANVEQAKRVLERLNLLGEPFSPDLPVAELHWIIADSCECIVLETTRCGVNIICNKVGVLTNNPPFKFHLDNLNLYRHLSNSDPKQAFGEDIPFDVFSRGMGAFGLPGDWSSTSRFVRAAFVRANAMDALGEDRERGIDHGGKDYESIAQFFHILSSVSMVKGCVKVGDGFEFTQYSSCCDTERGIYCFKSYDKTYVQYVDMNEYDINSRELIEIPLDRCKRI
jgi:choloylglycine hydrolase